MQYILLARNSSLQIRILQKMNGSTSMPADPSPSERPLKKIPPCSQCRQRKIKCDKQQPCQNCQKALIDCVYQIDSRSSADTQPELQERIHQLEARLGLLTSLFPAVSSVSPQPAPSTVSSPELECHCGRQVLGTDFSVHFDYYMNWVELFPKVGCK
jgi:hypothetical protein